MASLYLNGKLLFEFVSSSLVMNVTENQTNVKTLSCQSIRQFICAAESFSTENCNDKLRQQIPETVVLIKNTN